MKQIFAIIIGLFMVFQISAQQTTDGTSSPVAKQPERNKDRLLIGVYNCMWQGLTTGVKQRSISQGYTAAFMFDIPTSEKSLFSFGLGLGYARNHFYSNAVTKMNLPIDRTTIMTPVASGINYSQNKLSFTYINIPLELRFRSKIGIRAALGLRSGLLVDSYSTYYGENPDTQFYGNNGILKIVNKDISNTEKYLFELTARVGWKFVTLNGSYSLSKMFTDKGPQIYPYTVGVSLSLW
ncbi:MAG: outer membrane beta-barrel protein [Bacteroidota bacterium]